MEQILNFIVLLSNALADEDPEFAVKARNAFSALENGDEDNLDNCRVFTIKELEKNYLKLKVVEFDHNHGESMYSPDKSKQAIQRFRDDDLVKDMDDGRKVIDLDEKNSDYCQELVCTSPGTLLQPWIGEKSLGLKSWFMLWTMLNDITFRTFPDLEPVGHVKLGKILGISTRRGNMVYSSDWMEEATEIMLENQEKSENTRIFVGSHLWKRLLQLVLGIVMLSA